MAAAASVGGPARSAQCVQGQVQGRLASGTKPAARPAPQTPSSKGSVPAPHQLEADRGRKSPRGSQKLLRTPPRLPGSPGSPTTPQARLGSCGGGSTPARQRAAIARHRAAAAQPACQPAQHLVRGRQPGSCRTLVGAAAPSPKGLATLLVATPPSQGLKLRRLRHSAPACAGDIVCLSERLVHVSNPGSRRLQEASDRAYCCAGPACPAAAAHTPDTTQRSQHYCSPLQRLSQQCWQATACSPQMRLPAPGRVCRSWVQLLEPAELLQLRLQQLPLLSRPPPQTLSLLLSSQSRTPRQRSRQRCRTA